MIRIRVFPYQTLPEKEALSACLGEAVAADLGHGRRGKALQETLAGFCILKQMLPEVPLSAIRKTETGRPFFAGYPDLDFSITHCKGLVACALESAPGARVGLDAETLGTQEERAMRLIARRWFTPAEQARFEAAPTEETFLSLWTAKEAATKWTGEGLKRLSVPVPAEMQFRHYRVGAGILCAVCRKESNLPEALEIAESITK